NEILHGITRQVVLELMARHGTVHEERVLTEEELRRAQEIWATNSTREILPVTRLDGQAVGEGVPGLHWQRIHEQFQAYKAGL
ncbi:MAG: aminotransferase class IV, partial [Gammaproteobacteria bacterium]